MKPLFNNQPTDKAKTNFGDAPIANAKYKCETCPIGKPPCTFKVNTLNCELAVMRYRKQDEDGTLKKDENDDTVDMSMEDAEKKALADMFKECVLEGKEEGVDIESEPPKPKEDDDED